MSRQDSQLYLSPGQQDLLMAALSSNQGSTPGQRSDSGSSASPTQSKHALDSRYQNGKYDGTGRMASDSTQADLGPEESPYLDFDLDADGDDGFDFDVNGQMIGDYPDTNTDGDLHEKRKSIDGKEDDDEGGGKRREGDDKSGKKPGRKPLTNEPTSKRKAQNRAAQRAFRERKEKHLKDLETKVEDLEKASESANHENGLLRAQVEKLQVELKEYRKRLSWASNSGPGRSPPMSSTAPGAAARRNTGLNGNDFQFEFPKFGDLPSNHMFNGGNAAKPQVNNPTRSSTLPSKNTKQVVPGVIARNSFSSSSPKVPAPNYNSTGNSPMNSAVTASPPAQALQPTNNSFDTLTGLFSPSVLAASRNASFDYFPTTTPNNNTSQPLRNGLDHNSPNGVPGLYNNSSVSTTDSPSSSSDSQHPGSSIGTSPEPSLSSPSGHKLNDFGLNTISEESQLQNNFGGFATTPMADSNGINWFAQQNGGGFDPVLFGGYRDSQDAVVTQDFGTFFNDAFPLPDLGSPLHNYRDTAPSPAPKPDLIKQVDAVQNGEEEIVPGEDRAKLMTCNKIWDRLQSMEKFRNGEIDVDNLCSELRSKARCSEGGAVIEEKDVDRILGKAKGM